VSRRRKRSVACSRGIGQATLRPECGRRPAGDRPLLALHIVSEPRNLRQLLDQSTFWGRVASGCVVSLLTAYTVTSIGTVIAMGARGGPGSPLNWGPALAALLLLSALGVTLAYLGWAGFLLAARVAPAEGTTSRSWRVVGLVVGGSTTPAVLAFAPGWWSISGLAVLVLWFAAIWPIRIVAFRTTPRRWSIWSGAALALVGTVTNGLVLGVIAGRALT